jgi:tetratricopeptide (TPR) repeat protein
VIARTSAGRYKNTGKPLDEIGRELGVNYILESSTRREAGRVRVTTQLIRVSDQTQIWAESYDRELTSILSLQTDIARGIARSLTLTLLPAEAARLTDARPLNPEAYEAYLLGRAQARKLTAADLDAALRYFELALRKDPAYAPAYAGISRLWSARQQMHYVPASEATPRAKAAVAQALALDSTLAAAHYQLASIRTFSDWDWPGAEREFRRAIDLDPTYADGRALYSHLLLIMRRPAEALAQIQRALDLDPLSETPRAFYAVELNILGRHDEAIAQSREILRTVPTHPMALNQLGNAYYHKEMYPEALAAEQLRWSATGDSDMVAALERGYADGGYRGAERRAAETLAARPDSATQAFVVARLYLRAGDTDQAMEWLDKAYQARDPNMPYIGVGRTLGAVHADPRFQELLRRMKLPS